ncbi:MAG TPA: dihydrolipoamide acetyltransferase family protein, partial [Actinomycetes bacterium]|nr:dihydrolipoamide acetyltransferase family protein [Actinomycetes bacterium]
MPDLLRMPEIAAGTTEAVLSSWSVAENASVSAREVVATVETAKAVVDVEAESDGVILRLLVEPGAEVETGAPIALVGAAGESVADLDAVLRDLGVTSAPKTPATLQPDQEPAADVAVEVPEAAPTPSPIPDDVATTSAAQSGASSQDQPAETANGHRSGRVFASPLARRLAKEAGLAVEQIAGTGPHGRIVRRDVEQAAKVGTGTAAAETRPAAAGATGPAAGLRDPAGWRDVPHTKLRRLVAERLAESKTTAPHFYLRDTVPVDRLLALRAELNDGAETRVSVNDLVVKAVARAHVAVPELNVTWGPDAVRHYESVDVAVAVATDNGLLTPVLRAVEDMTITTVARTTRDLAERARSGQLRQHELEGGSISVTNLGMHGTE